MVTKPKETCIIRDGDRQRPKSSPIVRKHSPRPAIFLMKSDSNIFSRFAGSALALAIGATQGLAQSTRLKEAEVISRSGDQWVYTIIFIILSGVGLAYYLWRKSRRSIVKTRGKDSFEDRETSYFSSVDYDSDVDAE